MNEDEKEKTDAAQPESHPEKSDGQTSDTENYLALGLSLGLCLGAALGQLLFNNLALGISIGMCLGIAVGSSIKQKRQ